MQKRLLVLPFLAITLGGCSLPFVSGSKGVVEQVAQKTEEKAAQQAVLQNCKYDKDVCQYYAAMITAYSQPMVMKATTTMKNGDVTVATTKMDGKGNMDIVSTTKGKDESAMIILDKTTYIKDLKDNTWMKMTSDDSENKSSIFNPQAAVESFKEEAESIKETMTIKKLGEEACGSLTCLKYQMDESTLNTSSVVWFDTKEHKSRKMETKTSGVTNTVEFSYEPVTITAPSPVKDAPDFSKMMNGSGVKMPSADELKQMMKEVPQESGAESSSDQ